MTPKITDRISNVETDILRLEQRLIYQEQSLQYLKGDFEKFQAQFTKGYYDPSGKEVQTPEYQAGDVFNDEWEYAEDKKRVPRKEDEAYISYYGEVIEGCSGYGTWSHNDAGCRWILRKRQHATVY